jgi:hypothetical protein
MVGILMSNFTSVVRKHTTLEALGDGRLGCVVEQEEDRLYCQGLPERDLELVLARFEQAERRRAKAGHWDELVEIDVDVTRQREFTAKVRKLLSAPWYAYRRRKEVARRQGMPFQKEFILAPWVSKDPSAVGWASHWKEGRRVTISDRDDIAVRPDGMLMVRDPLAKEGYEELWVKVDMEKSLALQKVK